MINLFRLPLLLLAVAICFPRAAPVVIAAQESEPIPIYMLQGDGASTPMAGRYVDTVGVVTGIGLAGFYLQDPAGDGRPETSDGIYVYTRQRPNVNPGQCVRVNGALIDEFYEKSELSRVKSVETSTLCRTTAIASAPLPTLRYGEDPQQRFEAYEGMRVVLPSLTGVVHGPTKRFASGEAEIALAPAAIDPYLSDGRVFFDEPVELAQLLYVSGALDVPLPDLDHGDRVRVVSTTGDAPLAILDYNFGKYQLLLLPGSAVERIEGADMAPAPSAPAGEMDFTVCTYNLMGMGRGAAQHPDPAEYASELKRRAATIAEWLAGCTVVGLQEVGDVKDAEQLAAMLRADYGLPYAATALPSPQSNIPDFPLTNALLVRSDRAAVLAASSPQSCTPKDYDVVDPGACVSGEYPLFDRPPLVADLSVGGAWGEPFQLTVIVNHWKSKSGDEAVNLPRRVRQAQEVAALVQERLATNPTAAVIVLGDLNDYYTSEPVATVKTATEPDLVHLYDWLSPVSRYTYIYNGASQALDHVLATPQLAIRVGEVTLVRVDADHGMSATPGGDSVFHASDHDPVLVRIWPGGAGWIAGNVRYPGVHAALLTAAGEPIDAVVSDARGDLRFWNVAPGPYRVQLSPPSHITLPNVDVAITVVSGENRFLATARHQASEVGFQVAIWTGAPQASP